MEWTKQNNRLSIVKYYLWGELPRFSTLETLHLILYNSLMNPVEKKTAPRPMGKHGGVSCFPCRYQEPLVQETRCPDVKVFYQKPLVVGISLIWLGSKNVNCLNSFYWTSFFCGEVVLQFCKQWSDTHPSPGIGGAEMQLPLRKSLL